MQVFELEMRSDHALFLVVCRMLDGETVSNSLNTSMYTVTADNLEEFREQTAQQNVD